MTGEVFVIGSTGWWEVNLTTRWLEQYLVSAGLTVLVISRDVGIVLTVAIVNLAVGPRTFKPSLLGKTATAVYIATCLAVLIANYLGGGEAIVHGFVLLAAAITVLSALHYLGHAARVINQ